MSLSPRHLFRALLAACPPRLQARLAAWRSRGCATLGPGAYLHRSVQVLGLRQLAVGENSVVSQDTWFNVNHRDQAAPAIRIGRHCFIGRRNVFSSGVEIDVRDYVLTANDCFFLGSSHVVENPLQPVMTTGTTRSATIVVGVNCFIGAGARVIGNVRIGHGCVVGAASVLTRDLPPFSQAHGTPARIVKRFSFRSNRWVPVADFCAEDEAALPAEDTYLATLDAHGAPRMPYLAAGADMGNC
jgi:acetyltransferase-like isoleucine patch superfamily enzyme